MKAPRPVAGEEAMAELVTALGHDAAHLLARRFGGTTLYVPRLIGEHHPLRVLLGDDAADRLVQWFAGSRLSVPKQPTRRARVVELRRGTALTIPQIAIETGYSERHVYRLLGAIDADQLDLFDTAHNQP